jgi:hypothetical protein
MGNGHAPGTAIGLGIAGTGVIAFRFCGIRALRCWTAGLAVVVFFFAAFLTAGFLAGFFFAALLPALLRLATVVRRGADFRAAGFPADFAVDFLRAATLRGTFFVAAFFTVFFADFFAFAITTSDYFN